MTAFDRTDRRLTVITWMLGLNVWRCSSPLTRALADAMTDTDLPTARTTLKARYDDLQVKCRSCMRMRNVDLQALVDAGKATCRCFTSGSAAAIAGTAAAMPWWCRRSV
jgi:hypothetical protein